jgi:hypothetical protein
MFATCVDALASKGKLIIIGMMSQYSSGWAPSSHPGLTGGWGPYPNATSPTVMFLNVCML